MFRKSLAKDGCMIFVYDQPISMHFWMKNTYIPLSIAYTKKNKIIEIKQMSPKNESIVSSSIPVEYAIETNRGWFRKNRIFSGDSFTIEKVIK